MTPDGIASSCLEDLLRPLEAALELLAAYEVRSDDAIRQAAGDGHGPPNGLQVAAEEVGRIGYVGPDLEWWHLEVRATRQGDVGAVAAAHGAAGAGSMLWPSSSIADATNLELRQHPMPHRLDTDAGRSPELRGGAVNRLTDSRR